MCLPKSSRILLPSEYENMGGWTDVLHAPTRKNKIMVRSYLNNICSALTMVIFLRGPEFLEVTEAGHCVAVLIHLHLRLCRVRSRQREQKLRKKRSACLRAAEKVQ